MSTNPLPKKPAAKKAPAKKSTPAKRATKKPAGNPNLPPKKGVPQARQKRPPPVITPQGEVVAQLTPGEELFATLIATGKSQVGAIREAFPEYGHWKPSSQHTKAWELCLKPEVKRRVAELREQSAKAHGIEVADVLKGYINRAYADPRELVTYVYKACRYCHGIDHQYHFKAPEMRRALQKHEDKRHALLLRDKGDIGEFDEEGGIGYDELADPHKTCPVCRGRGEGRMVVKDLENLSPEALSLYAGMKEGKDGLQVLLNSQDSALAALARHVGFFEKDNEQQVPTPPNYTELGTFFDEALKKSRQDEAEAKERAARLRGA